MKLILTFLVLCAILFATNPSEKQFREYVKEDVKEKAGTEGELAKEVVKLLAGDKSWIKGLETHRKNYYVVSLYSIQTQGAAEVRYIGVLSHFFKLGS